MAYYNALLFQVYSIDTDLQSTSEFLVNKISTGSVASLDLWKDTLILGLSCIEFVNIKQFECKLRYEESEEMQNVSNQLTVHVKNSFFRC